MGCPETCNLNKNLTFSVCTHAPDTGLLTDASSVTYRVYNEAGATLLSGSMLKLDDANTTGCYATTIAVSTANGFENDKNYTIYIEATVAGIKGGITFQFKATHIPRRLATLVTGAVTDAQTAAEKFNEDGLQATVAPDNKGNRTVAWSE